MTQGHICWRVPILSPISPNLGWVYMLQVPAWGVKFVGCALMTPAWYTCPSMHTPLWWAITANSPIMIILINGRLFSLGSRVLHLDTKAVISLAGTQIRKYTNHLCEGFFCSWVFVRVFDLCEIVFFSSKCADARIFHTKWPIFYLCTCIFLFVAQINSPHGTFICRTNRRLQIHK